MESAALKASHGMNAGQKGVLVRSVEPLADAARVLKPGDVIMKFDGIQVASDGTVPFRHAPIISPVRSTVMIGTTSCQAVTCMHLLRGDGNLEQATDFAYVDCLLGICTEARSHIGWMAPCTLRRGNEVTYPGC